MQFNKFVPLPKVRQAAGNSLSAWRNLETRFADPQQLKTCSEEMDKIVLKLRMADVHAVTMLMLTLKHLLNPKHHRHPAVMEAIDAIRSELSSLSLGNVQPTLLLWRNAQALLAIGATDAPAVTAADFFLPCLPSAFFKVGTTAAFDEAVNKYSASMRSSVREYMRGQSKAEADKLAYVFQSLDNRGLGGVLGWLYSMTHVVLAHALTNNGTMPQSDLLLLMRAASTLSPAPAERRVDSFVLSRLAARMTEVDSPRARLLVRNYGLDSLRAAPSARPQLPDLSVFGARWRQLADSWEVYFREPTPVHAQDVSQKLSVLIASGEPSVDVKRMATDLQRLFQAIERGVFADAGAIRTLFTERLALINDVVSGGDVVLIAAEAETSGRIVDECLSQRSASVSVTSQVQLPVRELFDEVGVDLGEAIKTLDKPGADLAACQGSLRDTLGSLSLVDTTPGVPDFMGTAEKVIAQLGGRGREQLPFLRQAAEIMVRDMKSALDILQSVEKALAAPKVEAAAVKAERVLNSDRIDDREFFDVFFEEVIAVVARVQSDVEEIDRSMPTIDLDVATRLRRAFHTLKGNARAGGLQWLGESAYLFEDFYNSSLAAQNVPVALADASLTAATLFQSLCKSLGESSDSMVAVDVQAFEDLLAPCRAAVASAPETWSATEPMTLLPEPAPVPAPAPVAVAPAPAPVAVAPAPAPAPLTLEPVAAPAPVAASPAAIEPAPAPVAVAPAPAPLTLEPVAAPAPVAVAPVPAPAPVAVVAPAPLILEPVAVAPAPAPVPLPAAIEPAPAPAPAPELMAVAPVPAPVDKTAAPVTPEAAPTPPAVVAAPTSTPHPVVLPDAMVHLELLGAASDGNAPVDDDVLAVFIAESAAMVGLLHAELFKIRSGDSPASEHLVRAAHSLRGMGRIVNAPSLTDAANALERWGEYLVASGQLPTKESYKLAVVVTSEIAAQVDAVCRRENKPWSRLASSELLKSIGLDDHAAETATASLSLDSAADPAEAAETGDAPVAADPIEDVALDTPSLLVSLEPESSPATAPTPSQLAAAPVLTEVVSAAAAPSRATRTSNASAGAEGFFVKDGVSDDIDGEMLGDFMAEAQEILNGLDGQLEVFDPMSPDCKEINRLLHTLKGSARATGLLRLGAMVHQMEEATLETGTLVQAEAQDLAVRLQKAIDHIRQWLHEIENGGGQADAEQDRATAAVRSIGEDSSVRVPTASVQALSDLLGEIGIVHDRLSKGVRSAIGIVGSLRQPMARVLNLTQKIVSSINSRVDAGAAGAKEAQGFDALEMDRYTQSHEHARRLEEAAADVEQVVADLAQAMRVIEDALYDNQGFSNSAQSKVGSLSRTGLSLVEPRLRAVVRQASSDANKSCRLEIVGDAHVDRDIMDRLMPAIEHLLRNSIAHGIEAADTRRALGKQPNGVITISVQQDGAYVKIGIRDDGAGVDFDRVRQRAMERGLISDGRGVTEKELVEALFAPGFSTASSVTDLAGRGVGLDVVRETLRRVGGRVDLHSTRGIGAEFELHVPVSASRISGLLMRVDGKPYIIPSSLVNGVDHIQASRVGKSLLGKVRIEAQDGRSLDAYALSSLCGFDHPVGIRSFHPMVIPRGMEGCAVIADSIEFVNDVPIRHIQHSQIGSGVIAHSLLGDGFVAPVINIREVLSAWSQRSTIGQVEVQRKAALKPLVMVVDDSVTIRYLSKRLLEKHGYDVVLAEDGSVAIDYLSNQDNRAPSAILMDIEMPVMDGFQACQTIKAMHTRRHIPLTIISSRSGEKHVTMARELGADNFFGKPYKDSELLAWVGEAVKRMDGAHESAHLAPVSLAEAA